MGTIYNCDSSELVTKTSEELKKVEAIKSPEWALIVKTGMHKERPPVKNDWWHTRAASVLRQIYLYGPIGVSKLRAKYGGKKNRGMKPGRFYKGSGSIIRKIFQQLEKTGYVKSGAKGVHKGRMVTAEGKKFLDSVAAQISVEILVKKKPKEKSASKTEKPKKVPKEKPKIKKEEKAESKKPEAKVTEK